jgi:hypothetical protein
MSNYSQSRVIKVVPYCQDPLSSCGLFAWGENTGRAPAGTVFQPMFFSGKPSRTSMPLMPSPSYLPPVCPEGYSGRHPNCNKNESKEKFSGFNWGGLFGGSGGSGDGENLADDHVGQMPDEGGGSSSGSGGKISADQVMSGIESATELAKLFGTKRALSEVESVCGKQRLLASKSKKQAWANCASAYMQSKLDASKSNDKKGLSTGAWIGIGLGAVVVIGGGIFLATKNKTQPQVIMMQAPIK